MAGSDFRLGIDFGTSNTVAVLRWPDGRAKSLLFDGSPLLPSAVYVEADGSILTGRDAVHSARLQPHRFEPYPKRHIEDGTVWLGDREIASVDLIASVLRRVATEALRVAGGVPGAVTVTHPAAWGGQRREALSRATRAAGLPAPQLAAEPVAAASYFVGTVGAHVPVGGCAVVYDFGAGTFDASVVRRTPGGGFEVLAGEGLTDAGGLDVDAAVVAYLGQLLSARAADEWRRLSQPETQQDRRAAWQLWEDVRLAKEMLSRATTTYVQVPLVDESVPLGREQLEQLARPILDRTVTATQLAVSAAGATQPGAIFLVGGSSRIPLAATLLHRAFGIAPTAIEQPELVVAEGALQLTPLTGRAVAPTSGAPTPTSGAPTSGAPVRVPAGAAPASRPPAPAAPPAQQVPPAMPPGGPARPPVGPARPMAVPVAPPAGPVAPPVTRPGPPPYPTGPARPPAVNPVSPGPVASPVAPVPAPVRPGGSRRTRALVAGGVVLLLVVGGLVTYALWPTGGGSGTHHQPPVAVSPACGYKIAALGVFTGNNKGDGVAVRDAVKLAVEQYNGKHAGCTVTLSEYDTQNTLNDQDDQAGPQAKRIADDKRTLGVVGPIYTAEATDALPILQTGGLPVISPSATDTTLSQKGWTVFHRTIGTDQDQADAGVRYLTRVLKVSRTYVVDDGTDFGTGAAGEVNRKLGTVAVGSDSLPDTGSDYSAIVAKVKASGADSVYFGGFSTAGGTFVQQLRKALPAVTVLAGDRVFTDTFIQAAGKNAAEGVYITCPCVPPSQARGNFADQFANRFKDAPGYYAPEAYDAANVLLAGLAAGKGTRADLLAWVNGYDGDGISRHVKFTPKGDLDGAHPQVWAYRVNAGDVKKEAVIPDA